MNNKICLLSYFSTKHVRHGSYISGTLHILKDHVANERSLIAVNEHGLNLPSF